MALNIKDLSREKEGTLFEMLDYLCSKVDFGGAALDSTAVICMSILFKELLKQKSKFNL